MGNTGPGLLLSGTDQVGHSAWRPGGLGQNGGRGGLRKAPDKRKKGREGGEKQFVSLSK